MRAFIFGVLALTAVPAVANNPNTVLPYSVDRPVEPNRAFSNRVDYGSTTSLVERAHNLRDACKRARSPRMLQRCDEARARYRALIDAQRVREQAAPTAVRG